EEAAQVLSFITKPDQRDLRAVQGPDHPRTFDHEAGVRGVRVAYVARFGGHAVDPETAAITGRAADILTGQGAIITEETLNIGEQARNIIRPLWWSAARAIVSAVPEELQDQIDPGLRRIAEAGWKFTAADYIGAMVARSDLYGAILGFMQRYDLIISPAMPIPAFEAGLEAPREGYGDDWIEWSPYTYPFNLTGQPAASVPCGLTSGGLPVGLQIVGSRYGDELVLRAAHAIERDRLMPAFIAGKTS
ncbi:MAG: amidase, partial [Pseudolabrys sp.]|nr:amidase [Pseudolabrys sp.]